MSKRSLGIPSVMPYIVQRKQWPEQGRVILAAQDKVNYDHHYHSLIIFIETLDAVLVYQSYCKEIAEYAIHNQK